MQSGLTAEEENAALCLVLAFEATEEDVGVTTATTDADAASVVDASVQEFAANAVELTTASTSRGQLAHNRCYHGKLHSKCNICSDCGHGKVRYACSTCDGCIHGKIYRKCAICSDCGHGKVRYSCSECNDCGHGKIRRNCGICNDCGHGKLRHNYSSCTEVKTQTDGIKHHRCSNRHIVLKLLIPPTPPTLLDLR